MSSIAFNPHTLFKLLFSTVDISPWLSTFQTDRLRPATLSVLKEKRRGIQSWNFTSPILDKHLCLFFFFLNLNARFAYCKVLHSYWHTHSYRTSHAFGHSSVLQEISHTGPVSKPRSHYRLPSHSLDFSSLEFAPSCWAQLSHWHHPGLASHSDSNPAPANQNGFLCSAPHSLCYEDLSHPGHAKVYLSR